MAAPSSLDRAAAALLAAEAITLPRKQSGITRCTLCLVVLYPVPVADPPPRFIGEILRGATPFRPRFGRASSSRRGESALVIGRATDRCFQEAIETGRVPARTDRTTFAVNALSALRGTGVRSVRTQFPVMHGTVGTRLDGIGVCTRHGQTYIVIIELKTTGRDPADNRAYDCPCSLLPDLHLLGLPNTERTAHSIQAEFGRIAFVSSYPSLARWPTVSAVVLASSTRAVVRFVPRIVSGRNRLEDIFRSHAVTGPPPRSGFSALPTARDGGSIVRRHMQQQGFRIISSRARVPAGASFICTAGGMTIVCGLRPRFKAQGAKAREAEEASIRRHSKGSPAAVVYRAGTKWLLHRVL